MKEEKHWQNRVELSLDNRQIFLLFFASAVALSLVFALGIVVGKRMEGAPARAPSTDPLALIDQMGNDDGEDALTFHEALATEGKKPAAEKKGIAEAPAAAKEPAEGAAVDDETAADEAPKAEAKKPAAKTVAAAPKPAPAPAPAAIAAPAPKATAKAVAAAKPAKAKPEKVAAAEPAGKDKVAKPSKEPEGDSSYTLQLSAFQEKREAETFMQKLRQAGLKPYMTSTSIPGRGVWYRVRLGHFKNWDDALSAKQEFEKKQKMIAYVSKS